MSDLPDENLRTAQLSAELNVSERTLERWRGSDKGPRYVRIGDRLVIYRRVDVKEWLAARTFSSNAQELAQELTHAANLPKAGGPLS